MNGVPSAKVNIETHFLLDDDGPLVLSDLTKSNKLGICCKSLSSSRTCANGKMRKGKGETET